MAVLNQTLFKITFNWNRTKFEASRHQCRVARKRIEISINVQFEKQMRGVFSQNIHIEENINASDEHLVKYHDKLRVLENMIELASQSLIVYFQKRMENIRAIIYEHCQTIQQVLEEEAEHWKEIHALLDQNLLNPGDIRSRNNYPKIVQKSPGSNIQAIDEVDEEETTQMQMSKLMNGKTLTPLLTQMIRKSRLETKQSPTLPISNEHIDLSMSHETSVMRKHGGISFHILPLSTNHPPSKIVDATFVIKPEEANLFGEILYPLRDEANGTYRANNLQYLHDPLACQGETSLLDYQPQIPARLCFSPTILHDATGISPENHAEEESSASSTSSPEHTQIPVIKIDRCNFGRTFLLDAIKKEPVTMDNRNYIRPAIPDEDDDVVIILQVAPPPLPPPVPLVTTRDVALNTSNLPVPVKSRTRVKTKSKQKSVVISTRKTRSATTKDVVERASTTVITVAPTAKTSETKRKTRKRKPSKSIELQEESSDEETNRITPVPIETKPKTKKRKKSNSDSKRPSENETEEKKRRSSNRQRQTESKRKTQSKTHDEDHREPTNRRKTRQRTKVEEQEREQSDHEQMARNEAIKRKKAKAKSKTEKETTQTRTKKSRKTEDADEQSKDRETRLATKREIRSTRIR